MISIEVVVAQVSGLTREDLERWIAHEWVRPERQPRSAAIDTATSTAAPRANQPPEAGTGAAGEIYLFREIDVARVRLIRELRDDLHVNEEALPVVLSLLDQLYDHRRRLRELGEALTATAPEEVRREIARYLAQREE